MSQTQPQILAMKIYNVGDYVGTLYLGSQQQAVSVTLDTGSSTLAVDQQYYNQQNDSDAKATSLSQNAHYGSGSWSGPVVQTTVTINSPNVNVSLPSGNVSLPSSSVSLASVNVGVAMQQKNMFSSASNGILGLAYQPMNDAQSGKLQRTTIEPFFTQLEQAGVTTNVFSFYTLRSMQSLATNDPTTDPLNYGWLILGGGREQTQLYTGTFQEALIVDDVYYNVNLKSIQVGSSAPIQVPPSSGPTSNCIIDSGTNGLVLPSSVCNELLQQFSSSQQTIILKALKNGGMYPQRQQRPGRHRVRPHQSARLSAASRFVTAGCA